MLSIKIIKSILEINYVNLNIFQNISKTVIDIINAIQNYNNLTSVERLCSISSNDCQNES